LSLYRAVIKTLQHRHRDLLHRGALLADRLRIVVAQRLAIAFFGGQPAGADSGGHFEDPDRIRAVGVQIGSNIGVETDEDGSDRDERCDSDHDAQHREKRSQLILVQRGKRHFRVFVERDSHRFPVSI